MLVRNTTWTLSRDTTLSFNFAGVNYYDGQGFMINAKKIPGVNSALQLSGASVCVQTGTTTELNLADYFKANNLDYNPVVFEKLEEVNAAYDSGRCDVYTTDQSGLYSIRLALTAPDDHVVLPEIISKEPLGPLVRQGDDQWFDVVKWTAQRAGHRRGTRHHPGQCRGDEGLRRIPRSSACSAWKPTPSSAPTSALGEDWVVNIVKAVGNYGEIFERNIGSGSNLKIARGINALWSKGGLQYAPPIR